MSATQKETVLSIEKYVRNDVRHIIFPKGYFKNDAPIHCSKEQHPTWKLETEGKLYKFGGLINNDDKDNPFIHIITFDTEEDTSCSNDDNFAEMRNFLMIRDMQKLVLGMHVREVTSHGEVFYEHGANGMPKRIGEMNKENLFGDNAPLETMVMLAKTPKRFMYQNLGDSNPRENLFRIGGEPTWERNAEVPSCPCCKNKMDFLMQIDSELPTDRDDGVHHFGDGGICYIFWCGKCKVSGYTAQST